MTELIRMCGWCNPPEKDFQPTLPGFDKTHGICPEHMALVMYRSGTKAFERYLSRLHLTPEMLLEKYLIRDLNK